MSVLARKIADLEAREQERSERDGRNESNTVALVSALTALDERVCVLIQVMKDLVAHKPRMKTTDEIDWQSYHDEYVTKASREETSTPTPNEETDYPEGTQVFGGS